MSSIASVTYTADTFPYDILTYIRPARWNSGRPKHDVKKYADIIATFDIECTNMPEIKQSFMWHWQACVDGFVCVGRTWEEYQTFLAGIDRELPEGLCFVQYVHNLAYEFQFLRAIHDFTEDEVFCLTGRKVAKCEIGKRFEYRCSYCLTNMSLREFLKKMEVEHQKTELDYDKIRYPWTPISESELEYCIADVLGLYEALRRMMKQDRQNVANVPMTSTGYVRQDFKKAMRKGGFIPLVKECAPSYDVYLMLRRAFRGGNTHANRCYTGIIMENVTSYDRNSSYPDVLINMPYPIKPFQLQRWTRDLDDLEDGFPYLLEVVFEDIKQKDPFYGCPYLSIHKCYDLRSIINDNGRVVQAEQLRTFLTDIDLGIMREQYEWSSARILKAYRSEYGFLPSAMRDVTMDYYRRKTQLKGVECQEVYYNKAKNKLNSVYGMCATNPVRTSMIFNGTDFEVKEVNEEEQLEKANRKSFTVFAWGCWCTAWSRYWLEKAIRLCGHNFIYCDTDSVKYVGTVDFTELNKEIQANSERHGAFADDPAGRRHYLGVYEHDATYKRFVTLGAKKYAYEDEKGLHITISGVSKSGAKEMGCLENFREGFIFHESAGLEAFYNDQRMEDPLIIDGHELPIPPNIYLSPGKYRLGLTADYKWLFRLTQEQYDKILKSR